MTDDRALEHMKGESEQTHPPRTTEQCPENAPDQDHDISTCLSKKSIVRTQPLQVSRSRTLKKTETCSSSVITKFQNKTSNVSISTYPPKISHACQDKEGKVNKPRLGSLNQAFWICDLIALKTQRLSEDLGAGNF